MAFIYLYFKAPAKSDSPRDLSCIEGRNSNVMMTIGVYLFLRGPAGALVLSVVLFGVCVFFFVRGSRERGPIKYMISQNTDLSDTIVDTTARGARCLS